MVTNLLLSGPACRPAVLRTKLSSPETPQSRDRSRVRTHSCYRPFDADALAHVKVHAKHGWLHEKNKQAKRMLRLTYGQREARKNVGLGLFNGGNFCEQGADGVSSEDGRQAA